MLHFQQFAVHYFPQLWYVHVIVGCSYTAIL